MNIKKIIKLTLISSFLAYYSSTISAASITGHISDASEVDYINFSVNSTTDLTIDILAFENRLAAGNDFFGNGIGNDLLNSEIYLFETDLFGALIGHNDDSGGEGSSDGSRFRADSFLALTSLTTGNYILAIGDQSLSETDARNGTNTGSLNNRLGMYQITFTGNNSDDISIQAVPTPGIFSLLIIGFLAWIGANIKPLRKPKIANN